MKCKHERRGHANGYLTVFCKDCYDILDYSWELAEWQSTGRKYRDFWCRIGLHSWCKHPQVESCFPMGLRAETTYRCAICHLEHEHDKITGRFLPVSEEKRCCKCEEVRK